VAVRAKKTNRSKRVDSVRASRDGHQFHEAWVARRALGLLLHAKWFYGASVGQVQRASFARRCTRRRTTRSAA
jgi:hypothetical protein